MTDHGWLDHHDDDHDPGFHDEPQHFEEPQHFDEPHQFEEPQHFDDAQHVEDSHHEDDVPYEHTPDHQPLTEESDTDTVFPPALDVGPLPEPVDGFPWIDTGSLGVVDAGLIDHTTAVDPVDPHELAEYAATDLPPGADPWAALADSEDPATANLARWWADHQQ
jgi:hypothetical protein